MNQLVPFKYKWASDKLLSGCARITGCRKRSTHAQRDIELWKNPAGLTMTSG